MNNTILTDDSDINSQMPAKITIAGNVVSLQGSWNILNMNELIAGWQKIVWPKQQKLVIDGSGLKNFDSLGACLLIKLFQKLKKKNQDYQLRSLHKRHQAILDLIVKKQEESKKATPKAILNPLAQLGKITMEHVIAAFSFFQFIGEVTIVALRSIRHPTLLQWKLFLNTIQRTGLNALPIVGLLSFLIGIVLAYQMGVQLETYGANIFIVDLTGIAILREFAPLITAIIVAGRTSSSFTAEIGTMKAHEEIDALRTFGLNPNELLTLPKVLGLTIAMPLLTIWSDLFGVFGGMIMARNMLGIHFQDFLIRFKQNIALSHFMIGIGKAPVFAGIIAMVGCYHGFQVPGSADSVGKHTTKSVVLAIFLIIIADAIFSIIFNRLGL